MVKGAQKQMIVVKINDSNLFEEAYFVVRRGASAGRLDMISEANKIVQASIARRCLGRSELARAVMLAVASFFAGSLVGAMIVGFVTILS